MSVLVIVYVLRCCVYSMMTRVGAPVEICSRFQKPGRGRIRNPGPGAPLRRRQAGQARWPSALRIVHLCVQVEWPQRERSLCIYSVSFAIGCMIMNERCGQSVGDPCVCDVTTCAVEVQGALAVLDVPSHVLGLVVAVLVQWIVQDQPLDGNLHQFALDVFHVSLLTARPVFKCSM